MIVGLLDVVGDHVLKGQHSLNIQIPCARDEVLRIGVFTSQLIANEMAAVIYVAQQLTSSFSRIILLAGPDVKCIVDI